MYGRNSGPAKHQKNIESDGLDSKEYNQSLCFSDYVGNPFPAENAENQNLDRLPQQDPFLLHCFVMEVLLNGACGFLRLRGEAHEEIQKVAALLQGITPDDEDFADLTHTHAEWIGRKIQIEDHIKWKLGRVASPTQIRDKWMSWSEKSFKFDSESPSDADRIENIVRSFPILFKIEDFLDDLCDSQRPNLSTDLDVRIKVLFLIMRLSLHCLGNAALVQKI